MQKIQVIITLPLRNWGELEDCLSVLDAEASTPRFLESEKPTSPPKVVRGPRNEITWEVYKKIKQYNAKHPKRTYAQLRKDLQLPHSESTIGKIVIGQYDHRFTDQEVLDNVAY